ncbi:MAG: membrane protein insertion efficiency factor YidD [Clostridia bacterium]|nr:membrane protein insertion efficiency factor YidD [Clostridia bacterium]
MDNKNYEETVSESKEESILKAIRLLEEASSTEGQRTLTRPSISVWRTLLKHLILIITYVVLCFAAVALLRYLKIGTPFAVLVPVALGIVWLAVNFKGICVDFVLLYQKLAPERIRRSCLFEPSCSEYMLLAIEKYGSVKGVYLGIKRLFRCHPPNGGVDYP